MKEFKWWIIMGILNEDKLNKKDIDKILSLENNITLFKISNRNFWSKVTISGSVIHTLVDVYITNNDFSRLITIEIPCANMYSESDLNKNDYNKLLFINRELQQIVTNLTNDLEKLLDIN